MRLRKIFVALAVIVPLVFASPANANGCASGTINEIHKKVTGRDIYCL
jgi:hypothetical protein